MATVRFKGTIIGNGAQLEGISNPSNPTIITMTGSPAFTGPEGSTDQFMTNVANAISNLAINGAVSIYMTTSGADKTAIEAAVTIIPASNQD